MRSSTVSESSHRLRLEVPIYPPIHGFWRWLRASGKNTPSFPRTLGLSSGLRPRSDGDGPQIGLRRNSKPLHALIVVRCKPSLLQLLLFLIRVGVEDLATIAIPIAVFHRVRRRHKLVHDARRRPRSCWRDRRIAIPSVLPRRCPC
jgi:hypothetical protein